MLNCENSCQTSILSNSFGQNFTLSLCCPKKHMQTKIHICNWPEFPFQIYLTYSRKARHDMIVSGRRHDPADLSV